MTGAYTNKAMDAKKKKQLFGSLDAAKEFQRYQSRVRQINKPRKKEDYLRALASFGFYDARGKLTIVEPVLGR